jgi:hypothetical protein
MNEMTKLCYEVSEADVARARNQLKASLLFLQDSSQRECLFGGSRGVGGGGRGGKTVVSSSSRHMQGCPLAWQCADAGALGSM